jgi:hypothetical protein
LNLKPSLNLDLKTPIENEMKKELENSEKNKKERAAQTSLVGPARPRARAVRQADLACQRQFSLARALPPSLAAR